MDTQFQKSQDEKTLPVGNLSANKAGENLTGMILGNCRLVKLIGSGGSASVFKAVHEKLDVARALKVVYCDPLLGTTISDRFIHEAKISARLRHPNIVEIHNADVAGNWFFMEMEYIDGENLRSFIGKGPHPLNRVFDIIISIARALEHAHRALVVYNKNEYRGIIHRDIKPENIMVEKSGRVVLTDFGIAKIRECESTTIDGTVKGTWSYMSPEQIDGKIVDARSDIFSLGAVFYELLTGKRPFEGETITQYVKSMLTQRIECPSKINGQIRGEVDEIVLKCLSEDKDMRYKNVSELLADLEAGKGENRDYPGERTISRKNKPVLPKRSVLHKFFLAAGLLGAVLLSVMLFFNSEADIKTLPEAPPQKIVKMRSEEKTEIIKSGPSVVLEAGKRSNHLVVKNKKPVKNRIIQKPVKRKLEQQSLNPLKKADNFRSNGDYEQAAFYYQEAFNSTRDSEILNRLAFCLFKKGELANALLNYQKVSDYSSRIRKNEYIIGEAAFYSALILQRTIEPENYAANKKKMIMKWQVFLRDHGNSEELNELIKMAKKNMLVVNSW
ncbi:MAG: protein kinase [bacterium]